MAIFLTKEANRCLNCKKPMCKMGCPVSTEIPQIIQMFKAGETREAGAKLFENNPMSVVCAMVCNHEAQCTGHCVLGRKGEPVRFYEIERYLSDTYLDRIKMPKIEKKHKSVAVIGSGPAGITVAIILTLHGYDVTMFEERSYIGGMLHYGIPDFRLPKSILKRYQALLVRMGVKIRPNTVIGTRDDITFPAIQPNRDLLTPNYPSCKNRKEQEERPLLFLIVNNPAPKGTGFSAGEFYNKAACQAAEEGKKFIF